MSVACDSDNDEDDIFIVKRRKPIGWLTKQKAYEIKKKVLEKESFISSVDHETILNSTLVKSEIENRVRISPDITNQKGKRIFDGDANDISILEERVTTEAVANSVRETQSREMKTPVKRKETAKYSPEKLITHYFSPSKMSPVKSSISSDIEVPHKKKVKHEPVDEKLISPSKLQAKEMKFNGYNNDDDISPKFLKSNTSFMNEIERTYGNYSYSLKRILHNEVSKQTSLEQRMLKEGKQFQTLITADELHNVINFLKMPENAIELFTRMLCRKKGWHRVSKINYKFIEGNVGDILRVLNEKNFVDFDVYNESIETMLELLKKPEIQKLCAKFNIKSKGTGRRNEYINEILRSQQTQRSVSDMWMKDGMSRREQLLKEEIRNTLGPCMRLNNSFLSVLNRFLLLFSLPHSYSQTADDWWNSQIYMISKVNMNIISFPNYIVKPTVIFESRNDFIFYEKAMELSRQFDEVLANKNAEEFSAIGQKAKAEFKKLLKDEGFKDRISNLPPFLRRFNAGTVYARILTHYCEKFKKSKDSSEVVEIMKILINQDVFLVRKKGNWYNLLVAAYSDMRKFEEAGSTILTALSDELVNEAEKLTLQQRGLNLLRRKKNGPKWNELRDELDDACITDVTDPPKIVIRGKALEETKPGSKMVYTFKDKSGGRTFSSVEETVINHYMKNGFTKGVHDEGSIIKTLYCLVFFDIIYKLSPPGVFQSEYQSEPLDFQSSSFYSNRKAYIDSRLEEMRTWSMDKLEALISEVYTENFGYECVITWREDFTANVLCEVLKCVGIQEFTKICERLVRNFYVYRSGFPDLTIWNPSTGKCKFVEVKSPNDKLSPKQRLWLDFLRKLNLDCEVCSVKNTASRRIAYASKVLDKAKTK